VLITRGSGGSTVRHEGRTVDVPAHPLPRDPTGAGDAFGAAYLSSRAEGYGPVAAARRATSVVASLL
jgi:sugar/nucleoside kinase (ribokinase family)